MALVPLDPSGPAALPPSDYPLNLLLDWSPARRSRAGWAKVLAASLAVHLLALLAAVQLPSFVAPSVETTPRVIVHHIPLYLPPDLLTQKAPNLAKPSKQIDLASLLAEQQPRRASQSSPAPSIKHFGLPKRAATQKPAKAPQILAEAPNIALNQTPGPLPPGAANGLPAVAPPLTTAGPFQNLGEDTPPPAHPALAPPKATVQSAINELAQHDASNQVVITDDSPTEPSPSATHTPGQLGAQHSAVELQSDPEGADFKPYLTRILAIVRANWRHVIPESARLGTVRGRTVLEFIISRDGRIPKLVTAQSSGLEPLDRAAIAGLSMSDPLPPLPADFKGMQVRLAFSFAYNMPAQ
jgi:TonB family protein